MDLNFRVLEGFSLIKGRQSGTFEYRSRMADEKKQLLDEQDRPKEPPTYEDVLKENRVLKEENERNAHPSKQYQHKPHRKGNGGYPGMHKTTYNDADMKKEI